jgi:hypothetical protein
MLVTVFPGSCEVEVAKSKHATTRRLVTILRRSRKAEIDLAFSNGSPPMQDYKYKRISQDMTLRSSLVSLLKLCAVSKYEYEASFFEPQNQEAMHRTH